MDLKPSNIVINIDGQALLIDISGVGGLTPEWTAPEVRDKEFSNISQSERALSDIWAYGRIMFALAQSRNWGDEVAFFCKAIVETTAGPKPAKTKGRLTAPAARPPTNRLSYSSVCHY